MVSKREHQETDRSGFLYTKMKQNSFAANIFINLETSMIQQAGSQRHCHFVRM